ncbi:hypothetical protein OS242_09040 [Tumebacillus sp. DT12]|uniref:Uncharacterized protein n=1 Tax=Tumebacillus lacus TaxID=2995335 RepID=A0ABT3X5W7_9BACL|nr:hypothetical protein [Tumebacillus lacus]MCX7570109.1 hypothetical protein [Tumebacillus lacus]
MTQEIAQDITPGAAVLAVGNFPAIHACVQEATFKDHLLQANSLTELFTQAGMQLFLYS